MIKKKAATQDVCRAHASFSPSQSSSHSPRPRKRPRSTVTRWDWHYAPVGGAKVDIETNGRITPFAPPLPPPSDIVGPFGMFGVSETGDGMPALVGTVLLVRLSHGSRRD